MYDYPECVWRQTSRSQKLGLRLIITVHAFVNVRYKIRRKCRQDQSKVHCGLCIPNERELRLSCLSPRTSTAPWTMRRQFGTNISSCQRHICQIERLRTGELKVHRGINCIGCNLHQETPKKYPDVCKQSMHLPRMSKTMQLAIGVADELYLGSWKCLRLLGMVKD